jgi:hypothetical protein
MELGVNTVRESEVPVTGAAWADLFRKAGAHIYTSPESYFRRQGDLVMFCTGTAGKHVLKFPASDSGKRFVDPLNGGSYVAPVISLETECPKTWLFVPAR